MSLSGLSSRRDDMKIVQCFSFGDHGLKAVSPEETAESEEAWKLKRQRTGRTPRPGGRSRDMLAREASWSAASPLPLWPCAASVKSNLLQGWGRIFEKFRGCVVFVLVLLCQIGRASCRERV